MRSFKKAISQRWPVGPSVKRFLWSVLIVSTVIFFLLFYFVPKGLLYSVIFQSVVALLFFIFIFGFNPAPPWGNKDRFLLSLNAFIFFLTHFLLLISWLFVHFSHAVKAFTYISYYFLFMSILSFIFGCYMLKKIKLSFNAPIWEVTTLKIKYPTFLELN